MREPRTYEAPACAEIGGDYWFPEQNSSPMETKIAKSVCNSCAHKIECMEWGIVNEKEFGIWGGLTPVERGRIRRERKIA